LDCIVGMILFDDWGLIGLDEIKDCNNHQHKRTQIPEPPK